MQAQPTVAKVSLFIGTLLCILGALMLCYCPWIFAIATVAYAISAATARGWVRWFSVVCVSLAVALSIKVATLKEREQSIGFEATLRLYEKNAGQSAPATPDGKSSPGHN
jgi:hypothetical protein